MNKILVSGYYGFDNFGDETVLKILLDKLSNDIVTVISSNPKKTILKHRVNSIKTFDILNIIKEILNSDIVISGGGSLLQDVTSFKSLLYYIWIINTALFFRKKVIIFAQGIGPLNNFFSKFLVKNALKKCEIVTVRDDKSLFLLRGWGISKTELVCDPLFDLPNTHNLKKTSNFLGVQLRDFKTVSLGFLHKLAEQICKEFPDKSIKIYSFQDTLDLNICNKFKLIINSINPNIKTEIIQLNEYQDLAKSISELDYLIAMRFHACLLAIKCGVKTLAISYDDKVEKLANEAQIPQITMLQNDNYDLLFKKLKALKSDDLYKYADNKNFDWDKFPLLNTNINLL